MGIWIVVLTLMLLAYRYGAFVMYRKRQREIHFSIK